MSFDAGAIVGRMVLDTEKWDKAVASVQAQSKKLSEKADEVGKSFLQTGRQLDRLGNKLSLTGGLILAPFALALKSASASNYELQNRIDNLGSSFNRLNQTLASNLVPWIDRLDKLVKDLSDGFQKMDPALRSFIVNFTIISALLISGTGIILKIIGLVDILIGAFFKIGGAIAAFVSANPFGALLISVTALVLATDKLHINWMNIANAITTTFNQGLVAIFHTINQIFYEMVGNILRAIASISGLPKAIRDAVQKAANEMDEWAKYSAEQAKGAIDKINNAWSNLFSDTSTPTNRLNEFFAGLNKGLKSSIAEFDNWGKFGAQIASQTFQAMESAFTNFFYNGMINGFHGLRQAAADFGRALLQMFAQIVARILIYFAIILPLVTAFPALGAALSIPIPSKQEGGEIGHTGIYRLHEGEHVTPKYDAEKTNQNQKITIYNLITPEAVANAMSGREGEGVIVNTINQNSLRNGVIRREVVRR